MDEERASSDAVPGEPPPPPVPPPPEPAAVADPLRGPASFESWRRFVRTRGGAALVVFGTLFAYVVVGQFLPGCAIGIVLAGLAGGNMERVQARLPEMIPYIVLFGALVAPLLLVGLRRTKALPEDPPRPASRPALKYVASVVAASAACLLAQMGTGWLQEELDAPVVEPELTKQMLESGTVAAWLAIVLAAPFAEEIVFRRIIHRTLRVAYPATVAYLGSAVLFAAIHFHLPAFANYCVIGTACALAYERTGRLSAAFLVHALNNSAAMVQSKFD